MVDRRTGVIVAFALRFLRDNIEGDIQEALNVDLVTMEVSPPLTDSDELGEIADRFCGEIP